MITENIGTDLQWNKILLPLASWNYWFLIVNKSFYYNVHLAQGPRASRAYREKVLQNERHT